MKTITLILFSVTLFVWQADAQSFTTFQKLYSCGGTGAIARGMQPTNDGGYIITASGYSTPGASEDIFLVKTDAAGDTIWQKSYGGGLGDDSYAVQQTSDNGYAVAGFTSSFGQGGRETYLLKTDENGTLQWSKTYGGMYNDYWNAFQQTTDHGYILVGTTQSFGAAFKDAYVIKTNSNGDTLWTRTFGSADGDEEAQAVQQIKGGGYIVAGYAGGFGNNSYNDIYLIKLKANGDTVWTKTYGSTGIEAAYAVQQTADGGYILAGGTTSFVNENNSYALKTDSNGVLEWSRMYGGSDIDIFYSAQQTSDGGYIFAGSTQSFGDISTQQPHYYVVKTNSVGDTLWTKTYGGADLDIAYAVYQTGDKGYAISGYTVSFGVTSQNIYLVKTDSLGNSKCSESATNTIVVSPPTVTKRVQTVVKSGAAVGSPDSHGLPIVGSITIECFVLGTNDVTLDNSTLSIYPNPADGKFVMENSEPALVSVTLCDVVGKIIQHTIVPPSSRITVDVSAYADGIYFCTIKKNGISETMKVVVQH